MRYYRTLSFMIIAAISIAACGGHAQMPPTASSQVGSSQSALAKLGTLLKRTLASGTTGFCAPSIIIISCIVPLGGGASCSTSPFLSYSSIVCNVAVPSTLQFKIQQSIDPAPGNYPGGTCSASTWTVPHPTLTNGATVIANVSVSPTTTGSLQPCDPSLDPNRVDSLTLTVKVLPDAAFFITTTPTYEGSFGANTIAAWKDYTADGLGITNHSVTFDVNFNITSILYGANMVYFANAFYKHETCKFFGYGGEGCAAAFNWIASSAVRRSFGGTQTFNVPAVHAGLTAAGLTSVNQAQAHAGDVAIAPQDDHIGVCMTDGCTQILSNSTSHCAFQWRSDGNFDGDYDTDGPSSTYLTWPKTLN